MGVVSQKGLVHLVSHSRVEGSRFERVPGGPFSAFNVLDREADQTGKWISKKAPKSRNMEILIDAQQ